MSHLTKLKTKFLDRTILETTLKSLGYTILDTTLLKSINGNKKVDLVASKDDYYNIGFIRNKEGSYDIVGDWWEIKAKTGKNENQIIEQITQKYAYNKVLVEVKKKGFIVSEEKVMEDNSIKLVIRKWN